MSWTLICLIVLSVALSSGSQLILKQGMTSPSVHESLQGGGVLDVLLVIATSPAILAGLFCFGLSVVIWLFVLSKVPVSTAYPFVALGITTTVLGGRFLFGEPLSLLKIIGVVVILLGIVLVGLAGTNELNAPPSQNSSDKDN